MSPRILILSASVGAGHLRAAQAVELALREVAPDATVENVDVLQLATPVFRRLYGKAYLDLVNHAPQMLGYLYDLLDRPPAKMGQGDRLRYLAQKLNTGKFLKYLQRGRWDVIVNTHFLPTEMIAHLRNNGKLQTPQLTVTTDFETHRLWIHPPCDHYFTATAEGAANLAHWGVDRATISVSGIPIHPVFSRPKNRADVLARQGLQGDRPIVLLLAGGFGVGPIAKIFRGVAALERPLEIVTVAGRNEKLREQLEAESVPSHQRVKHLGFTDQMDELLAVADIVLTKPGGLTTSEVLARGAAMAIVNPIPGQETRNSDYLLENGAAIKINNLATLPFKLSELLENPARLRTLKENALRLGKPQAAFEVAAAALAWARGAAPEAILAPAHLA
ncbi:MAG TPA: glycosyltransferase [Pirellulales bacterium]|jgi:processive 1,2-diacylglycerol beta-glucosyltransferase|nr:glycosyltransferase [Pirellulales bacterium]